MRRPAGWLSPWIAETEHTPDLLDEAGYRYVLDWCMDDQPVWLKTRSGRILAVPYPQELNDSAAIIGRRVSAAEFADMIIDQFDEMLEQSREQPLVMGIALHAMIVGQPFRLRQLRRAFAHLARHREAVWLTTAGADRAALRRRVASPHLHSPACTPACQSATWRIAVGTNLDLCGDQSSPATETTAQERAQTMGRRTSS